MSRSKCCKIRDVDGNVIISGDAINRPNRLRIGPGSGIKFLRGGGVQNSAIIHKPENKSTGVCGCRTRPVSSSFFNST